MRVTSIVVAAALSVLAGCSGGPANSTSLTANPPPAAGNGNLYLMINLATGAQSTTDTTPTYAGVGSILIFQQVTVGGSTLYVTPIPVTESQYRALIPAIPWPWSAVPLRYRPASDTPDTPAYGLSQTQAVTFANLVTTVSGRSITVIAPNTWTAMAAPGLAAFPTPLTFTSSLSWAYTAEAAQTPGPRDVGVSAADPGGWHDVWGNVRCWTSDGRLAGPSWMDNLGPCITTPIYSGVPPTTAHPLAGMRLQTSYP